MLETYALYSTELTDEERALGFELVEIQDHLAVVCRFSETDQIVKMNVPVIGGNSYRHERRTGSGSKWVPVGSIVFPTAEQALNSVGSMRELCH